MPKLSIIIVNWNTAKLLMSCLKSLEFEIQNLKFEAEVIVVDNGSIDDSIKELKNLKLDIENSLKIKNLKLEIIQNDKNLGFAKGNNIGIKQAKGEYIMLLNSDTVVKQGAIERLIDFLDKNPEFSIVGPRLLNQDKTPQANCGWFPDLKVCFLMLFKEHFGGSKAVRFSPDKSQQVDWLMGAAFVARKEVFEKTKGLDENIFMYMEEVEWFYRARKFGYLSWFLKEAEIIHLGRGSSKSGKTEPIVNIYKGVLYFFKKHRSLPEVLILKLMLRAKTIMALTLGFIKNDNYLKETYGQTLKIS